MRRKNIIFNSLFGLVNILTTKPLISIIRTKIKYIFVIKKIVIDQNLLIGKKCLKKSLLSDKVYDN